MSRQCSRLKVSDCSTNSIDLNGALTRGVDVALVAYALPVVNAEFLIHPFRKAFPRTKFIAFVNHKNAKTVVSAFREGARGVFDSSGTVSALCKCVRAVRDGQIWASSEDLVNIADSLNEAPPDSASRPKLAMLSKRETDVVQLVIEGLANRDIARQVGLTEHTVTNYLYSAYGKLGISKRVELILLMKHVG